MSLAKYISDQCIDLDLYFDFEEKEDEHPNTLLWRKKEMVLQELVQLLDASGKIKNSKRLFTHILNREKKATTGLGEGFALPHVRTMEARELTMALARCPEGVDFGAMDGEPVYVFLAMVAPPHDDNLYLRIYKEIAQGISEGLMDEILNAHHVGEVYRALKKH